LLVTQLGIFFISHGFSGGQIHTLLVFVYGSSSSSSFIGFMQPKGWIIAVLFNYRN